MDNVILRSLQVVQFPLGLLILQGIACEPRLPMTIFKLSCHFFCVKLPPSVQTLMSFQRSDVTFSIQPSLILTFDLNPEPGCKLYNFESFEIGWKKYTPNTKTQPASFSEIIAFVTYEKM